VVAKSLALPCDHGAQLYECQGALPARPQTGEPGPEQAIGRTEPRARVRLLVDCQLMPARYVLQVQCDA
jgi:hypothetical protein